jgi:hypothetical protein
MRRRWRRRRSTENLHTKNTSQKLHNSAATDMISQVCLPV